jgi:hypothetical protein
MWAIKVSHTTVWEFIYVFQVLQSMFSEIHALMLSAYRLKIVISFWCISTFISMECPSLSHLIKVALKSTLSEISIATSTCFRGPLAW